MNRTLIRDVRLVAVLWVLLGLSACSALPFAGTDDASRGQTGDPAAEQGSVEPIPEAAPLPEAQPDVSRSPAVRSLLELAQADRSLGNDEQAVVRLERALRIQPRDAQVWLELARIYFDRSEFATAAQFADKANRLAGDNDVLRQQATKLSAKAQKAGH